MLGKHERMARYSLIDVIDSAQTQHSAAAQFDALRVGWVAQSPPDIVQFLAPLDTPRQVVHRRERN